MTHDIFDRLIVWRDPRTLRWTKVKHRRWFSLIWRELPEEEWPNVEGRIDYRSGK